MIDFATLMETLRSGEANQKASEKLADVAAAVARTGKAGSLTITLNVKPAGEGRVMISDNSKTSTPELPTQDSLYFVTKAGDLSRKDPYQTRLADLDPKDR